MGIIQWVSRCFPFQSFSTHGYQPKKDDDQNVESARVWIDSNPINVQNLRSLNIYQSQEYGKQIIIGLKLIYIDSSNEDIIKCHLVKICQINNLVKQYIYKHLSEIKADPQVKNALLDTICTTLPPMS